MSLPSIPQIIAERKLTKPFTLEQSEQILVEAIRRDLPEAVALLHRKAHEAERGGGQALWMEDPGSPIGRQLTRIHASDALRPLVVKYFCHGKELTFINCCNGSVGTKPRYEAVLAMQIDAQDGTTASPDC